MVEYKDIAEALLQLLDQEKGLTLITSENDEKYIPYKKMYGNSMVVYEILKRNGAQKGNEVIIYCKKLENYIYGFWACVLGGFIAVPISTVNNEYKSSVNDSIFNLLVKPYIVYDDLEIRNIDLKVFENRKVNLGLIDYDSYEFDESINKDISKGNDIVYVQFSSGSTGQPKGSIMRKSNLSTNIADIIERLEMNNQDKSLSWQPLTHCYGLIVFHLLPIMLGIDQYLILTDVFMHSPMLWLEKANKYRITRLGLVPFALKHLMGFYEKSDLSYEWDLSCIKTITIGGEHVSYEACDNFTDLMGRYKLNKNTIIPIYGLAESTTCLSLLSLNTKLNLRKISREDIGVGGKVQVLEGDSKEGISYLELGKPLSSVEVKIIDDDNNTLPEDTIGYILAKGENVSDGYYRDPLNTKKVFLNDGWLDTGDIGFIKNGNVLVVGREKELIVVNGVKYTCIDIEDIISKKVSMNKFGQVVVCNGLDSENRVERAVVFVQNSLDLSDSKVVDSFYEVSCNIKNVVFETAGLTIDAVIPIEKIPKTTSGKIRRTELAGRFNVGEFSKILEKVCQRQEDKREANQVETETLSISKIQTIIVDIIEKMFQIKVSNFESSFQEYGIVSINIPYFIDKINEIFNCNIQVSALFNYPNIIKLTKHIYRIKNSEGKEKENMVMENASIQEEDKIAIIGMSCRFPNGANTIEEYWDMLVEGRDGICDVPDTRWDLEKYYSEDENAPGKMYCRKGGFLNVPIDEFDARFFNISPKEAKALDPQQRLALELTWEAFENAGLDITKYSGTNTGVYLGISTVEYTLAHLYSGQLSNIDAYSLTGGCMSTACGRISYTFGFEGPSVSVDTACSSSLTALHIACNAMKAGQTDLIVLCGVNLMISPTNNIGFSKLHATSVDGHSKAFDASANGYGRGEGGGVLLLKKLSDAKRDNDNILGIIRGTGINQDGRSNGLTAPNGVSQAKLIKNTLEEANLSSTDIDYVEMHGTGTKLGDPIEVGAVSEIYCKNRSTSEPLKIGSVKSNIGHLEAAAGIAAIEKVLLSFKNNLIPGNLHFNTPNPFIDWEKSNVKVIGKHTSWLKENGLRRVGLNGFGFGGSNAHVIIEEYKENKVIDKVENTSQGLNYILKISAKSENSLKKQVENYINLLKESEDAVFEDIIYTADRGRADLDCRLAVTGATKDEILQKLENYIAGEQPEGVFCNVGEKKLFLKDRKLVFMFTGQGSQYVNMGRLLFETNKVFKDTMLQCDKLFKPYILKSIISLIYDENADSAVIEKTNYAQPLIFAIEYALFKMLGSFGISPQIVMGHSIGEYAAAVVSGIFSLEDAVKLVSIRGRLMDSAPGSGSMGTIFANEDVTKSLIEDYKDVISIAAHNAKETCVISGDSAAVDKILNQAQEKGIRIAKLKVSHGFHSQLMEPIMQDFEIIAQEVSFNSPKVRFISTAYAEEIGENQILDSTYWTNHIRDKVDFYKSVAKIKGFEDNVLLEVGSNRVLSALCKLIFDDERIIASTLNLKKADSIQLSETIALLYIAGVDINWDKVEFIGRKNWTKYPLPIYPFERVSCWSELLYDRVNNNTVCDDSNHKLLGQKIESPSINDGVVFQRKFLMDNPFFMSEHIIYDTPISPAAAHISMLLSTIKEIKKPASCTIKELELRVPLSIYNDEERLVQVCIENAVESESKFSIVSKDLQSRNTKWTTHTQGFISASKDLYNCEKPLKIDEIKDSDFDCDIESSLYDFMRSHGFDLGEGFRRIKKTHYGNGESICFIEPLKSIPDLDMYELYPGVIDSILQTLFYEVLDGLKEGLKNSNGENTIIPYYIGSITYNYKESNNLWCHTTANFKDNVIYGTIEAFNEKGELIIEIKNVMAKLTNKESLLREMKNNYSSLYYHTDWVKEANGKEPVINAAEQYVLVSNNLQMAEDLKEKLFGKSIIPINVICSDSYVKENEFLYYVDYQQENWVNLLNSISSKQRSKLKFVYINGINNECGDSLESVKTDCLKGLLYLVQAINSAGIDGISKIKIVTKNVQKLGSINKINLQQSMIWGFAKVLGIEYPQLYNGIIDINEECILSDSNILQNEIISDNVEEVCLRGSSDRYVSRLIKNSEYMKKDCEKAEKISFTQDGTYLITGGTGALGMIYAEDLVSKGNKNLVLMCRRQPSDEVAAKIKGFIERGVRVEVVFADICNEESLKQAIESIRERLPQIKGVIHAAGSLRDKMIIDQTWEDFETVLGPKVDGTVNVYNALNKEELDFFIMLSSITSVVGNMGQSNYSAANYFMNSFAVQMEMNNLPGFTYCWGPWQGNGMTSENDLISKNMDSLGIKTFAPETGIRIISEFFEQPYTNLLIADIDWNKFCNSPSGESKKEFLSKVIEQKHENKNTTNVTNDVSALQELQNMDKDERGAFLIGKLKNICGNVMGFTKGQQPEVDVSFTEQGIDSLMVFSIRSSVNKLLGTDLSVSSFFNYPTILKLTDYLLDEVVFCQEDDVQESTEDLLLELENLTE